MERLDAIVAARLAGTQAKIAKRNRRKERRRRPKPVAEVERREEAAREGTEKR